MALVVLLAAIVLVASDARRRAAAVQMSGEIPTALAMEAQSSTERPCRKRVLLAEDNEINQRIAMRILEKSGYDAKAVGNGKLAVEELSRSRYDIVLMDIQMPEMDGLEATARIREMESPVRRIPIIAVTANCMAGDREKCLSAGMDDYIPKPMDLTKLRLALEKWSSVEWAAA